MMTKMPWFILLTVVAVVAGCQIANTDDGNRAAGGDDEPLRLDSDEAAALLGIDDMSPSPKHAGDSDKAVSNTRCLVCHGNFSHEELSVTHARNGVSCERCHGASDAHCADENNITPPDIMYARDTLVKACMVCHPADKLSHEEHHWDVFAPKNGTPKKVCTDCHGKHRIASRDVRWNKKTGQLIKGGWMEERKE